MATRIEALDELIALASHAGYLGAEAHTAHAIAYGKRDRKLTARATKARNDASIAEQKLSAARTAFLANTGSWNWSAELIECKPDLIDAIQAGERDIAERKQRKAAFTAQQVKDRKVAYHVALYALRGIRLSSQDAPDGHPFAYFAEETRSWWAITPDAMIQLADMLEAKPSEVRENHPEVIEAWAKMDKTAVELDSALSRRLSREHGR